MSSYLDLIEQLQNYVETEGFLYTEETEAFRDKKIAVSGRWFLEQVFSVKIGDIVTGFSRESAIAEVKQMDNFFKGLNCSYKVVFDGLTFLSDKPEKFKNECNQLSNLHQMYWTFEICKTFFETEKSGKEQTENLSKIQAARNVTYSTQILKFFKLNIYQEYLMDILSELEVEYILTPSDSSRQLAYLYSNDYCECVVGDVEMILFDKKVPQVATHIDIKKEKFSFFDCREVQQSLKLTYNDESRVYELWQFYNHHFNLVKSDSAIFKAFDLSVRSVLGLKENYQKCYAESLSQLKQNAKILSDIFVTYTRDQLNEHIYLAAKLKDAGLDKDLREQADVLRDGRQIMTQNCEFIYYPNESKTNITQKDKLRNQYALDWKKNNRMYPFYCFDVISAKYLASTNLSCNYSYRISPPAADSEEHRNFVDSYFKPVFENVIGELIAGLTKLYLIYTYYLDAYHFSAPCRIENAKSQARWVLSERVIQYFDESAFEEWERDTGRKANGDFKNILTIFYHMLHASPESGSINLTKLTEKSKTAQKQSEGAQNDSGADIKENNQAGKNSAEVIPQRKLTEREVLGFINLNLLEDIDYIKISDKKLLILGNQLTRKGTEDLQDKLVLILELLKQGICNGEFMNTPEKKFTASKLTTEDSFLINSFRKTSEEIRNRKKQPNIDLEEISETISTKRKESEFMLMKDGEFTKELTLHHYEKSINLIVKQIQSSKKYFYAFMDKNKLILDSAVEILNNGIYDKHVANILQVSRCYMFIDSRVEFTNDKSPLVDFDSSQFLDVLMLIQKTLRLKTESLFYTAVTKGFDMIELPELIKLKSKLKFRTGYNTHASNLIKVLLTRYVCNTQIIDSCPPEYANLLQSDFTVKGIQKEFSQYKSIQDDLLAGYELIRNVRKIIDFGAERGLDSNLSPLIVRWKESEKLLENMLTALKLLQEHFQI